MQPGSTVAVMVGQGGIDFCAMHAFGKKLDDITLLAFQTLPWACRTTEFGKSAMVWGCRHEHDGRVCSYSFALLAETQTKFKTPLRTFLVRACHDCRAFPTSVLLVPKTEIAILKRPWRVYTCLFLMIAACGCAPAGWVAETA
jgi:hypothetical protein